MTSYAARLMPNVAKGKCGDTEFVQDDEVVVAEVIELAGLIRHSQHCIIHTGAGISTAAGICDFRGPTGTIKSQCTI